MFSVVVPVYNKRHTLLRTVRTVLAQTFAEFELVILDDGSTDGSMAAIAQVGDGRIRELTQPNAGPGPARNAAIAAAQGEWIALLDADDLWAPHHLAELARLRARHPDAQLIGTASEMAQARHAKAALLGLAGYSSDRIREVDLIAAFGRRQRPLFTSSAAFPKSAWDRAGGFGNQPTGQDRDFFVRLALQGSIAISARRTAVAVYGTGGISDLRAKSPRAVALASLADLAPSVRTLLEARGEAAAARSQAIDLYARAYLHWAVRQAASGRDRASLRALDSLYRAPVPWLDRLMLSCGSLPDRWARPALALLTRLG